ncbi:DeoR/GlpR family DNA-binding transcription regulator [uncultured Parabacteroides sp.]|uniref:DeoR/GlpR family DNA-binding transcription regulator n=1 Tax=uncultured Parabacteroides sp. TaxID=512312 RepID=UPI00262C9C3B|nr:DeoR/GlpR family DNA-binding transcription regulator [uncultured Parabacteroides sp.]
MLKEERHEYILNQISKGNRIYVTALSIELGVSDDTLRRDLTELDNKGLLTKVHGGAIAKSGISIKYTERLNTAISVKQRIAAKVIPLFKEGDIILMDGGTSNLEVARQIPQDFELTIFTNSFPIVNELVNHPKVDLNFLGGKVFQSSQVTVGLSVYQALQNITPDWVVLGISDIHPEKGLTCPDREEAMIKRAMIERGIKSIILADGYKLNTARAYRVVSLGEIDYIVTEDDKVDYIEQNWPKYSYKVL